MDFYWLRLIELFRQDLCHLRDSNAFLSRRKTFLSLLQHTVVNSPWKVPCYITKCFHNLALSDPDILPQLLNSEQLFVQTLALQFLPPQYLDANFQLISDVSSTSSVLFCSLISNVSLLSAILSTSAFFFLFFCFLQLL
ncbi:hypothetical protein GEMRC1_008485 [Eukaryota sp. GEM-RC1]